MRYMCLGRADANTQGIRNLRVGLSFGDKAENFLFSCSQGPVPRPGNMEVTFIGSQNDIVCHLGPGHRIRVVTELALGKEYRFTECTPA
jgi:hypothetical protein